MGPDLGSDHLPMITEVRTAGVGVSRVRKPKWAFHKADWVAFTADYEAAFSEAGPQRTTAQELATRFNETVLGASAKHIPRGARANPKPWALDPELQAAMAERREAHRQLDPDDPPTRERWVASKQRAAEAEKKTSQKHFRKFVETTLNKPASVGRVSKILKAWERSGDDHRPEQALREEGRLLASDRDKAEAFNRTYAYVSRQVREAKLDRAAKRKVTELRLRGCQACAGQRCASCLEFYMEELEDHLRRLSEKKAPGPDGVTNEHLRHLGPAARRALLDVINASWLQGEVPRNGNAPPSSPSRRPGRRKKRVASYRPIALTSHVSKLLLLL